ncbi:Major facilitator superfamily domain general substrate transporter [Penicillium cf. griseofulvum]|uniref:Major facilitator superfamily domain general substrate transporter n=1 Tax=Penicillium cf. griseofulvum TaxID=2972120 RepID=A0A9W9J1N3_9EURO|nr:Major facilitator superfamily domain general substrate transporter [Penicillium cf. griseofulvum]KAJ5452262.1 Major facilitator superfamily domain general substrate transporter [Penicillium cf. griseofulvum]
MTFYLVTFCCAFAALGSFLFGYDSGVISSSIEQEAFLRQFGSPTLSDTAAGVITSSYTGGAIVGSVLAPYISDYYGRRMILFIGGLHAALGAGLQGGAVNIAMLIAGRSIAGLAIGQMSATIPVYCSEVAPPQIRGMLASMQQWMIGLGYVVAQWVGYGCSHRGGTFSWRFPLFFQVVPAIILTCGIWFLPESPRWLIEKGRDKEGHSVLVRLHLNQPETNTPQLEHEIFQIQESLASEKQSALRSWRQIALSPRWRHRILLACGLQVFTQCSGTGVISFHGPRLFKTLGLKTSTSLMMIGVWGALAVFWNTVFMLFIDKVGRRKLLIPSLLGMGAALCIEATLARNIDFSDPNANPHALRAGIAMFFVFSFFFTALGMISWIYQCEIFPTPIRARGSSMATAANWSVSLIFMQCSPIALKNIGSNYFYCFVAFNWAAMVVVWAFYPETVGRSLEGVEEAFAGQFVDEQSVRSFVVHDTPVANAPRSQIRHKGLHPLSMNPTYDTVSIGSSRSGSEMGIGTKEV